VIPPAGGRSLRRRDDELMRRVVGLQLSILLAVLGLLGLQLAHCG
jgi:hypothetical protein